MAAFFFFALELLRFLLQYSDNNLETLYVWSGFGDVSRTKSRLKRQAVRSVYSLNSTTTASIGVWSLHEQLAQHLYVLIVWSYMNMYIAIIIFQSIIHNRMDGVTISFFLVASLQLDNENYL